MKGLKNRICTIGLIIAMVCVFMPIGETAVYAAGFDKTEMSNPTYYASGCLKTLDVTIQADGYYATAYGKIGIHTATSPYNWNNRYTTAGNSWPSTINDATLVGLSSAEFLWSDGEEHRVTVEFVDGKVPGNQSREYVVHLWTRAPAYGVYTDATFEKLKVSSDGVLTFGNKVVLTEEPAAPTAPAAPTGLIAYKPSVIGGADGRVAGVDETMEYSLDGGKTWVSVSGKAITGLSAGTVQVRVKKSGNTPEGEIASVTVPEGTEKAAGPAAPGGLAAEKPFLIGGTDGRITGVDESMEYSLDGGKTWISVNGKEITGLSAGTVQVRVKETNRVKAGSAASVTVPEGTEKAEGPEAPEGLTTEKPFLIGGDDGTITGVDETMEYSLDGGETWIPVSGKEIAGLSAGDIQIRVKETDRVKAGGVIIITVPDGTEKAEGPAAPKRLKAYKPSVIGGPDGKITGVDETMEYSIDGGKSWQPVTGNSITGLSAGKVMIRVQETDRVKAGEAVTVTVPAQTTVYKRDSLKINKGFKLKTGKYVTVKWGSVKYADGYDIYMRYCGEYDTKYLMSVSSKSTKVTIKRLYGKSIDKRQNVKGYVTAYKWVNGKKVTIAKTVIGHSAGIKNYAATDPKKVVVKKSSFNLKPAKTAKIKARTIKENSRRALLGCNHAAEFRYKSSNNKVATVSVNGTIKAKAKGTCYVYVYALNGISKKITVNVK